MKEAHSQTCWTLKSQCIFVRKCGVNITFVSVVENFSTCLSTKSQATAQWFIHYVFLLITYFVISAATFLPEEVESCSSQISLFKSVLDLVGSKVDDA